MRRLTEAEICEPHVTLTIHPDRLQLDTPKEVEDLLRLYGECQYDGHNLVFTVAAYRYREEIEPVIWRHANDWVCRKMPATHDFIRYGLNLRFTADNLIQFFKERVNMNPGLLSQVTGAINHQLRERNLLKGE